MYFRIALVVNAERNSMGGVGISSTPSLQQSSDLEKTQAELRQTFTTAEKFRRELEFLQKGGDPLDLKPVNATSVSFQSTSLRGHPEQFVTSEAKGSFAITASPHGDSVESSGRLGAPEPNSADNLMLLKESGDTAVLELPKSRINDYKGLTHDANVALKNSISHLENELDGLPIKSDGAEAPLTTASIEPESVPTNGNTEETKSVPIGQHFDDYNGNGLHTTKPMEQNLGSNDLGAEKHDSALNIDLIGSDDHRTIKEEEGLKGSESVVGPDPVSQDGNANDPPATLTVNHSTDGAEQNTCSQDNLKSAAKEHENSVLEEARIIEVGKT
ncbi:hypothetical protein HanRHA438_Chr06g0258731 [Helianthus annuus]|nr:hypothetical protein HanRHA438_Chr06g0258731 [Helianthus annuus]